MPAKKQIRKDGRFSSQIFIGRIDGKRKYQTVYGSTPKEAKEKADAIRAKLKKGLDILAQTDTFKTWADSWLEVKSINISTSQVKSYKCSLKKLSSLNNIPISKIKAIDIQNILFEAASNNGKPLSHKTVKDIKSTAKQIFDYAIQNRVIDFNPVSATVIPKTKPPVIRRALEPLERQRIYEMNHRCQLPAMIMMHAGLRRGELIALNWKDIDFKRKTLTVDKTVEIIDGHSIIKIGGKTTSATRIIPIPDLLVTMLKAAKSEAKSIYICPSATGTIMSESAWTRLWNSYLTDLNIKYGTFIKTPKSKFQPGGVPLVIKRFTAHNLRHTYATMLYEAGIDALTAKYLLGHSDIRTTLNIYTHLDSEHAIKNIDKLNDYLSGNTMQVKCKSI